MSINKFYLEADKNTPEIDFNPKDGLLYLHGKSIPENATRFYEPIVEWLKEYIQNPAQETNLHYDLMYFNTASSIWMARIIKLLSRIQDREKLFILHLYFHIEEYDEMDSEDIQEAISPVTDVLNEASISIGVKIYGTDDYGSIQKEKLILF